MTRNFPSAMKFSRKFQAHSAHLGWSMLAIWLIWWTTNLVHGRVAEGGLTWIHPSFGVDFANHVDKGVRTWMGGGDPYAERHLLYPYPPIVLRLFIWVWLTTTAVSVRIWMCCAAVCAAIGAVAAVRARKELGLSVPPVGLAIGVILFSFPVLFALDRANYDLLVVPLIVGAVMLMRRNTATDDVIAGFLLAIAIWCKLYPGLLVVGVFALRRWRLAMWLAAFGALITLADPPQLMRFLVNNKIQVDTAWALARAYPTILAWNHPLPPSWHSLWVGTPLALLPGRDGAIILLGAPLLWVTWRVFRCPHSESVSMPYFFWLVALGSFAPPVANDYSLTPLPLTVLMTWNREDKWIVQAVFAALLLWWQPIALPLPGRVYLFIKLAGVIAAGYSLVALMARIAASAHQLNLSPPRTEALDDHSAI